MAEKRKEMIPLFKVYMSKEAVEEVNKVLVSGYIGQGPVVDQFENCLKDYFGSDYLVTTNSGTSAEHLALHLLREPDEEFKWEGLEDGDEILTTPLTCTATNWPILASRFKIKWVDIDPTNLNIDLDDLARKFTRETRACVFVHWGGYPVDLDRVKEIRNNVEEMYGFRPIIIEDSAHAFGATYHGKRIGSHGNINFFSLQAIKHVTSIDGGILITTSRRLHRRAKLVRWYGIDRETNKKDFRCEADISEWGYKFHMNDVCAAVGMANFKHIDEILSKNRENAKYYDEVLKGIPGVTLIQQEKDRESAYWLYSILVENKSGFMAKMKECNIMVSQVHERNDIHSCAEEFKSILPNLNKTVPKTICIPVGWWVTKEDREYIASCIKKGW